jgi:hypothetical protein
MRRSRKVFLVVGVVFIVTIAGLVLTYGVETWMRKTDPLRDVPSAEFQKTVSKTQATIGDIFTVDVFVGWHGHILPEWTRHVEVFDPYPEDYFVLAGGNNTYEYDGYGPGPAFTYSLRVVGGAGKTVQLLTPRFYLDGVEIPLRGTTPEIEITSP